jgi:hypothetical protein
MRGVASKCVPSACALRLAAGPRRLQSWQRGRITCRPLEGWWIHPMLSFAHTPTIRLMASMAALLSAAGTLPRPARPARSTGTHTLRRDRAVQCIFRPLPDEPDVRVPEPRLDWLDVAVHYRPIP